jgi:hypothetical protein
MSEDDLSSINLGSEFTIEITNNVEFEGALSAQEEFGGEIIGEEEAISVAIDFMHSLCVNDGQNSIIDKGERFFVEFAQEIITGRGNKEGFVPGMIQEIGYDEWDATDDIWVAGIRGIDKIQSHNDDVHKKMQQFNQSILEAAMNERESRIGERADERIALEEEGRPGEERASEEEKSNWEEDQKEREWRTAAEGDFLESEAAAEITALEEFAVADAFIVEVGEIALEFGEFAAL